MSRFFRVITVLILACTMAKAQSKIDSTEIKFQHLLDETGMVFKMPPGTVKTPIVKNMQMHYEYAVRYPDRPFEIRYSIAPLNKKDVAAFIERKKTDTAIKFNQDPNNLSKILVQVVALNVGGGVVDPNIGFGPFQPFAVKKEFGADWGGTTVVQVKNTSFGTDYKWCVMVTLHKDNVADAYIFYLSDTKENLFNIMKEDPSIGGRFYALKFKE